jgi:aryl-alcohol dehydrogenase-like predicted oxidoreductase
MANLPSSLQASIDSTKVEYRQLGKSGLRVSVPIFGCMSFGDKKAMSWVIDEEEVKTIPASSASFIT